MRFEQAKKVMAWLMVLIMTLAAAPVSALHAAGVEESNVINLTHPAL